MTTRATLRRLLFGLMFAAAATIVACGGDELAKQEAGVGAGGTGPGTASVGAITGFGSVYVNGIRFDDDAADIRSDDGTRLERRQLDLGMWVEVLGSVNANGSTGRADSIRVVRAVRGLVTKVEPLKNEFRVMGAKVRVTAATVFGGAGDAVGFAGVRVGDVVDVHGALDDRDDDASDDSDDRVFATRVERVAAGTPGQFSQRGRIVALTPGAFKLGGLTVNHAAARIDAPKGLSAGLMVTVIAAAPPVAGVLNADRVIAAPEFPSGVVDVALDGVVNQFDSLERFFIGTTRIDGTKAAFTGGTRTDIQPGARLLVRGTMVEDKLVAREIVLISGGASQSPAIALGPVTKFSSIEEFYVRGTRVNARAATFTNGTAASIAAGKNVEARGPFSDGVLRATQITVLP